MSTGKIKTLILCVDRDNDIGVKAEIETPVIGREANLLAASKLALHDPEESDANAMFGAVKTYDALSKEAGNEEYAVATIAGSELGGVKADKLLRDQLFGILDKFPAEGVVLVTDGYGDEDVIPIIQSRVSITSITRVVVKHSVAVEESWAVFSSYLRKLIEEPNYARWALGAPGILLTIVAILWTLSYYYIEIPADSIVLFSLGAILIIKGFGLDKLLIEWIPSPPNLVRLFTAAASLIIIALDAYQTYISLVKDLGAPSGWWQILPLVIGNAIRLSVDLLLVASFIFTIGLAVYLYFMRDQRMWWTAVGVVTSLWMREVALKASDIFLHPTPPIPGVLIQGLIFVVCLGIVATVITVFVTRRLGKQYASYFKRSEASYETG